MYSLRLEVCLFSVTWHQELANGEVEFQTGGSLSHNVSAQIHNFSRSILQSDFEMSREKRMQCSVSKDNKAEENGPEEAFR